MCWLDTTSATAKILSAITGSAWVVQAVLDVPTDRWQLDRRRYRNGGERGERRICAPRRGVQPFPAPPRSRHSVRIACRYRQTLIFGILTLTHKCDVADHSIGVSKTTAAGDVAEAIISQRQLALVSSYR